jgi:mannose-6-phosphate isomerase-like protein (cupin superfamily)
MGAYLTDIEKKTIKNNNFREVLNTTSRSQLVVMALQPGEEIGMEVHNEPLKLYSIYTPPEHPDGTVHATKADADAAEHHH